MPLTTLTDLTFPITGSQIHSLMENIAQLNILDAGLNKLSQNSLDLEFHIWQILAETNGQIDYTGKAGHERLKQDAVTFISFGSPIITKHGDIAAAHLAIDFNNTQAKLKAAGMPLLSSNKNILLNQCSDLAPLPSQIDERLSLFLKYLAKKPKV